ncbi:MAG: YwaF family protein [Lachnospiraceae bacterium]|nr:YwaF family protein [Lachnospiraceae bacterium]
MFTTGHFLFIIISTAFVIFGIEVCRRKKPPIRKMLITCLVLSIVSELTKFFYNITILPVVSPMIENDKLVYQETGAYAPYLEAEHLPFELCSLQILFMFLALVIKNKTLLKRLYTVMYTTCIIGGVIAILLSSATIGLSEINEFFFSIEVWRAFLYHSLLVVLGCYIGISDECDIRFKDIKWAFITILCLDFITMYINSMMATPYYLGDKLIGVGNVVNYFSSYNNPLGIPMKNKTEWAVYLIIRLVIGAALITLVNLPLLKKERSENGKAD